MLTEKAEAVEGHLELPNDNIDNIERFYDICDYIMDNHLLENSAYSIATTYTNHVLKKWSNDWAKEIKRVLN